MFTDFVRVGRDQYFIGFSIIGITLLNILINTLIMLVLTFKNIKRSFQRLRAWCKNRRKVKKNVEADITTSFNNKSMFNSSSRANDRSENSVAHENSFMDVEHFIEEVKDDFLKQSSIKNKSPSIDLFKNEVLLGF